MQEHPKYGKLISKPNLQAMKGSRKNKITITLTIFFFFTLFFLIPESVVSSPYCFAISIIFFCSIILLAMALRAQLDLMNLEFYEHGFIDHYTTGFGKREMSVDTYYLKGLDIYGQKQKGKRFRIMNVSNPWSTTFKTILKDLELDDTITYQKNTMPTEAIGCKPGSEYEIQDPTDNDFILVSLFLFSLMGATGIVAMIIGGNVEPLFFLVSAFPFLLSVSMKFFMKEPAPDRLYFYDDLLVYIPRFHENDYPDCFNYSIDLSCIEKLEYWNHWYQKKIKMWYNHERILGNFMITVSFLSKPQGLIENIFQDISAELPEDAVVNRK